jgi:hypothetical protein
VSGEEGRSGKELKGGGQEWSLFHEELFEWGLSFLHHAHLGALPLQQSPSKASRVFFLASAHCLSGSSATGSHRAVK